MTEFKEFVEGLGKLVGCKITGAAYSERDGEPIVILNLINEEKTVLTSFYLPLDHTRFDRTKAGDKS